MSRNHSCLGILVTMVASVGVFGANGTIAQHVFKCKDANGQVIYSQTECGSQQAEEWIAPITDTYGGPGGIPRVSPELSVDGPNSRSNSLQKEITRINKAVDNNIRAIKSSGRKVIPSTLFIGVVEMELNRLSQIASLPISSEADKQVIISGINDAARKALSFIDSYKVIESTRFEAESSVRTVQSELVSAVRNL